MQNTPCFMLSSIESLPLKYSLREHFATAMTEKKPQSLLFGFVSHKLRILNLIRPKKFSLHPSDLHLLFNMAVSSSSLHTSELWSPVCFPRFNNKGFLFVYISMLLPDVFMYLVTTKQDCFYELFEHRNSIIHYLNSKNAIADLQQFLDCSDDYLLLPEKIDTLLTKWICFKSKTYVQHISFLGKHIAQKYSSKSLQSSNPLPSNIPANFESNSAHASTAPFFGSKEQKRIFKMFRYCKKQLSEDSAFNFNQNDVLPSLTSITNQNTKHSGSSKVCYFNTAFDQIVAWSTTDFEIYGSFKIESDPEQITSILNSIVKYIRRNYEFLFVSNSPTY
ncbi:hypothetical protein BB561_004825 [Smittium simulii]|uniref:Vacuolar fusion protein MON1 n=1 Tax=Smittium simulii TaxID=133385 RepID=A0A2T9YDX2_9FUNG|nr:hypothetical protein BB561_004825 [Smittium simulii]